MSCISTPCDHFNLLVDVWTLAYTPDSRYLATGSHGGKINLYNLEDGTKFNSFDTRGKFTLSVACVSLTSLRRGAYQHIPFV